MVGAQLQATHMVCLAYASPSDVCDVTCTCLVYFNHCNAALKSNLNYFALFCPVSNSSVKHVSHVCVLQWELNGEIPFFIICMQLGALL